MAGTWNIGLDLGGCGIRMSLRHEGIVFDESAVAAFRYGSKEALALGNRAREIRGREPAGVRTGVMLEGGRVSREEALDMWLTRLIAEAKERGAGRTDILLVGGTNAREADLQAVRNAAMRCGAADVGVLEAEYACALGAWFPTDAGTEDGAQVDTTDGEGRIVIDIGAYGMFAAMIARGHIVARESRPFGMQSAVEALQMALRRDYAFSAGINTAEDILARSGETAAPIQAYGLHIEESLPCTVMIRQDTVRECVEPIAAEASAMARSLIAHMPDTLAGDVLKNGIMLTGGGAQSAIVAGRVKKECELKCRVSDKPSQAAIRGTVRVMNAPQHFGELVLQAAE